MNRVTTLTFGILITVMFSLLGLVTVPNWQFQELKSHKSDEGQELPAELWGATAEGRKVYMDLGCIYCHSQQVRPAGFGADIDRGWGTRRTVARDYIHDRPPLMGTMRTGPDLMNIAVRQPNREWQLLHLYDPQLTSRGSTMPRYPFLFRVLGQGERVPANAVKLPDSPGADPRWIVPNDRGERLLAYLFTLDRSYPLPEAK